MEKSRHSGFKLEIPSSYRLGNVRFAPGSGHYASIELNYRFVPKADIRLDRVRTISNDAMWTPDPAFH